MTNEISTALLWSLHRLGEEYGALGVAEAAALFTDVDVLVELLTGPANREPTPQ